MNETISPNFSDTWTGIISQLATENSDILQILQEPINSFRSVPIESQFQWINVAFTSWSKFTDEKILKQFFSVILAEFSKYLLEDISRLDTFINVIANGVESPHRMLFLTEYASIFPSYFPDSSQIDLNLLLAIQAPVFSYCVSRHPDSNAVCIYWFHSLAQSQGREIFKDNHQLAISYFKIMNHAFFQISVTTTSGAQQEETFVSAQTAMKSAIVAITRSICD